MNLTIEQQFKLASIRTEAQSLSKEQLIEYVVKLAQENMEQRDLYIDLIGSAWGFK